jgi:hypothetical protein
MRSPSPGCRPPAIRDQMRVVHRAAREDQAPRRARSIECGQPGGCVTGLGIPIADFPINTICLHEQFDTDLLSVWVPHAGR